MDQGPVIALIWIDMLTYTLNHELPADFKPGVKIHVELECLDDVALYVYDTDIYLLVQAHKGSRLLLCHHGQSHYLVDGFVLGVPM